MGLFGNLQQMYDANDAVKKQEKEAKDLFMQQLLMSNKNFNSEAQLGAWDRITPWDTGNEKAVDINKQLMMYKPGATQGVVDNYYKQNAQSTGYNMVDNFGKMITNEDVNKQDVIDKYNQPAEQYGSAVAPDELFNKYFGGSTVAQPVQKAIQPERELPSSLAPQDNISSFWDYLKNKQ